MSNETRICQTIQDAFDLLGKKWTGQIIHVLMEGEKHFCELTRSVPDLSDRMLSLRMRELEQAGVVVRVVLPDTPVRVVYRLTDKGSALQPVMESISTWAYAWAEAPMPANS